MKKKILLAVLSFITCLSIAETNKDILVNTNFEDLVSRYTISFVKNDTNDVKLVSSYLSTNVIKEINDVILLSDHMSSLDQEIINLIYKSIIETIGVSAPVIPPPATSPMNLVPPIAPQYNNQ